jgi:glutathione S-transferase
MELYYSQTSPYSRKVRICILEKSLSDRIALILCSPLENPEVLQHLNPLGKVPTLLMADGTALYDSPVICEYIDSLANAPMLLPRTKETRFQALRWQALGDGIMDATFAIVTEQRRTDAERSAQWLERWKRSIDRSLDVLEQEAVQQFSMEINLAQIAVGCSLGQLDFRLPDLNWRSDRLLLTDWFDLFNQRDAMQQTMPCL